MKETLSDALNNESIPTAWPNRTDAAVFLSRFGEDHLLCSMDPNSGHLRCYRGETGAVIRWAQAENDAQRNVYYHFNQVRAGVTVKASKDDITHIRGLPDDLDWGWKHHSGSYPTRLLELGNQHLQRRVSDTPPSLTVFTGGGFQNLYLFHSPLPATPDTIDRVQAPSRALVAEQGSDMVGNPDRLLRLPGFINYPNLNKAQAGQPEIAATVVFASGRTYSLDELEAAFVPGELGGGWTKNLGPVPAYMNASPFADELGAGIERPPLDLASIASAAGRLAAVGTYRTFANGQSNVRYDLSNRADWLSCAVFPAAYGIVEYPEHESQIRALFHKVSAKGVSGSYDPSEGIGGANDEKLDEEIARIRRGRSRTDHPSLNRWVSMAEGSGCAPKQVTPAGNAPYTPQWPEVFKDGSPKGGYRNAVEAIRGLGLTCEHDTFHGRKTIGGHSIGRFAGEITDDAIVALRDLIVRRFAFDPGKEHVFEAANALCIQNPFDPICDWLDSLVWDRKRRLDTWLVDYAGAADTALNRAIGVLLLVAMVRRAKQPGCKFDIMAVLEGQQGCGKSSLLAVLAGEPDNFTDTPVLKSDVKAVAEALRGKWMVEVSELVGLGQREVEEIKATITRTDDRARPAYGRCVESQPRRCIFVGTTNAEEYLRDDTGNRRFLPVRVGRIDIGSLKAVRAHLFAEAVQQEPAYGPLTLPQNVRQAAACEAQERLLTDPWVEQLREALDPVNGSARTSVETLGTGERRILTTKVGLALGLYPRDLNQHAYRRMASAMRALGFKKARWRPANTSAKAPGYIKAASP